MREPHGKNERYDAQIYNKQWQNTQAKYQKCNREISDEVKKKIKRFKWESTTDSPWQPNSLW